MDHQKVQQIINRPLCPNGQGCFTHLCKQGNTDLQVAQPPGYCVREAINEGSQKKKQKDE